MLPLGSPSTARPAFDGAGRGLLLGLLGLVATTLLKLAFREHIGGTTPFLLYSVPVLIAGWTGGWAAGLTITAVSALVVNFFFQTPPGHFGLTAPGVPLQSLVFWLEGVGLTWVTTTLRRERRRALDGEAEARAALAQLDAVIQGVDHGISLQTRDGKLLYANETAARMVGVESAQAMIDLPVEKFRERFVLLAPNGAPFDWEQLPSRVLLSGRAATDQLVRFRVLATGVERWSMVRAVALRDASGQLTHVLNLFRDVTGEQREAQRRAFIGSAAEQLSTSLDYEKTLATIAQLAVPTVADWCAVDMVQDGDLQRLAVAHVDPAKVAMVADIQRRYPPDRTAPSGTYHVLKTGEAEWLRQIPEELLAARAKDDEHLRLLRSLQLRSYVCAPLKRGTQTVGVITFVMAESGRLYEPADFELARELAARASVAIENAQLFRELQLANRTKDAFLAVLGHELRNPLAPIRTALQLMELHEPEHHRREREIIERQLGHVVRLVDDLLDVTRIARGSVELVRQPTWIAAIIESGLELAAPLLEARKLELHINVDVELYVKGDATRLAQVVSNLLNNAAKYTNSGGNIWIDAVASGPDALITVKDDGIGIAPDVLPRVFELFVQAPQALDRSQGGLGVGLAIARGLIESHGGSISASSEGPGKGSLFAIRLPLTTERPSIKPAPVTPPTPQLARQTVVVVDDNVDALESLSDALQFKGYRVEAANDGPSGLALVERLRPQVSLIDLGLPLMDGYEVARQLRQKPELQGIKLIAITGYGTSGDRERSRAAGFDLHLVKPVSLQQVLAAMETVTSS